jgi:hypothetical protein
MAIKLLEIKLRDNLILRAERTSEKAQAHIVDFVLSYEGSDTRVSDAAAAALVLMAQAVAPALKLG